MIEPHSRSWLTVAAGLFLLAGAAGGAEYHVAPDGKADGAGTRERPWDVVSALGGGQRVRPGDTVWLGGGTYRCERAYRRKGGGFEVKLAGTKARPIHVRARKGERVTLDGGVVVSAPSDYLWLWDLEITVAAGAGVSRETKTAGSHPSDLGMPMGGLRINAGKGCKFINLYVHDNFGSGVDWWRGSTDSEVYGCIIVNNGWKGPDRCHGHCIYTQNEKGTKTISHCILTTRWGRGQYTMHAYGSSRAFVDHYVIERNIAYAKGMFLVGGGKPSRDIVIRRNILYKVPMQIGYSAPHNEDCDVRENTVVGSSITVNRYRKAVVRGNLIVGGRLICRQCENVDRADNRLVDKLPPAARTVLLPNRYDPDRANLAVFNPAGAKEVTVNVAGFLKPGDAFRLMDPEDFHGRAVIEGRGKGETIRVPMSKPFAVFVLLRRPAG